MDQLEEAQGVSVGDRIQLLIDYGSHKKGDEGFICQIFSVKPMLMTAIEVGAEEIDIIAGDTDSILIKLPRKPKELPTLHLLKGGNKFVVAFDPRGAGYGSIHLWRNQFKVIK